MWQKELKNIKKILPETTTKQNQETKPIKIDSKQDVNFSDYCQQLKIEPIKQDKIALTKPKESLIKIDYSAKIIQQEFADFDFIDAENSSREFFRHGQKNLPKELRSGKIRFNKVIDVHNMNKVHALNLLERLIDSAKSGECIKIIHGVGLNSEYNQPVLLGTIRKYLQNISDVLAFTYGNPEQGGNGVTIVKLMR